MEQPHADRSPRTVEGLVAGVATTEAEREPVFRFRYGIYVEEMGRYRALADHRRRHLVDAEDDHSWIIYVRDGEDVVATTRLTWGGDGFSARQIDQYQLAPFLAEIPAARLLVGERTMIAPRWRGTDVFSALGEPSTAMTEAHDVRVVFGACEPHLISFYARYQRPYGTRNINSAESGLLIPLVSFPRGEDALVEFGAAGELPLSVCGVMAGSGTVLSPMLAGDAAYLEELAHAVGALRSSVFDGLDHDQVALCAARSNIVTCRSGDRLLKAGGSARNVFVVLEGSLVVSSGGSRVGEVGPGEVVGEMAHFLQQPRAFDVDVVEDGTRLVSLSQHTLAHLGDADPRAAAQLGTNISRQLCRRLASAPEAPVQHRGRPVGWVRLTDEDPTRPWRSRRPSVEAGGVRLHGQ